MEPTLALAVAVAAVCGAPFVVTGVGAALGGIGRLRVRAPRRAAPALALMLALRAVPAPAAPPPPGERLIHTGEDSAAGDPDREPAGQPFPTYRVVAGDSLWAIACRYLGAGGGAPTDAAINRYWRVIYAANRAVVGPDPDLIFPGQTLVIPREVP